MLKITVIDRFRVKVGEEEYLTSAVTRYFSCPECEGRIVYRFSGGKWCFACPRCDKALEYVREGIGRVVGYAGYPIYEKEGRE